MWYGHEQRHKDPQSRIETRKINPNVNNQMIFNKMPKQCKEGRQSSKIMLGPVDIHMQKMLLDPYLISYTKVNSGWFIDLN